MASGGRGVSWLSESKTSLVGALARGAEDRTALARGDPSDRVAFGRDRGARGRLAVFGRTLRTIPLLLSHPGLADPMAQPRNCIECHTVSTPIGGGKPG